VPLPEEVEEEEGAAAEISSRSADGDFLSRAAYG
jgi:hypothetical protein